MDLFKKSRSLTAAVMLAAVFTMSISLPENNATSKTGSFYQEVLPARTFSSLKIDAGNTKWFLTEKGLVSFDGVNWKLHNATGKLAPENIKGFALESGNGELSFWIASPEGVIVMAIPAEGGKEPVVYKAENSSISSNNVLSVAAGKGSVRWIGTDKGIAGLKNDKWLTPDYDVLYPDPMFKDFPITTMATSPDGDSLYVGTVGAGVTRVQRNDVDAITGASSYAYWGPIIIPSDNVYSIYISADGMKQWFGTDGGVGLHIGGSTLDNWEAYTIEEGLVDDFVQAITEAKDGKMWFGTKGGISVFDFDASEWTTYTTENGLLSNNILCLGTDKDGVIWIGTDSGVNCYKDGEFKSFR